MRMNARFFGSRKGSRLLIFEKNPKEKSEGVRPSIVTFFHNHPVGFGTEGRKARKERFLVFMIFCAT